VGTEGQGREWPRRARWGTQWKLAWGERWESERVEKGRSQLDIFPNKENVTVPVRALLSFFLARPLLAVGWPTPNLLHSALEGWGMPPAPLSGFL